MKNKRGISGVIAVVFLILLTIAAVGILTAFLIPYTKDNLNESTRCNDVTSELSLVPEKSCFDRTADYSGGMDPEPTGQTNVTVRLGNANVTGLYILVEMLDDSIDSVLCDVKNGEICAEVNEGNILTIPNSGGGQRTYSFTNVYNKVSIGVIAKDKKCTESEVVELRRC